MFWPYFIDVVDTLSPLVTLTFGVYGAVSDTKPKNGKLSRQGKIALSGMIISGMITLLVKGGSLYNKIQDQEAELAAKEKERIELARKDSVRLVFQQNVVDSLGKSISELNNIKKDSRQTLNSLNDVAEKQNIVLSDNKRGKNPLSPLQIEITYTIDLKNYYKNATFRSNGRSVKAYLSSLHIEQQKTSDRYFREMREKYPSRFDPSDTIPDKITTLYPLSKDQRRIWMQGDYFFGHFLFDVISLTFTKTERNKGKSLSISLGSNDIRDSVRRHLSSPSDIKLDCSVDIATQMVTVKILYPQPQIRSKDLADFVSFYDLQDTYLSVTVPHFRGKDKILRIENIRMLTGLKLSRELYFDFTDKDIPNDNSRAISHRKINASEIL